MHWLKQALTDPIMEFGMFVACMWCFAMGLGFVLGRISVRVPAAVAGETATATTRESASAVVQGFRFTTVTRHAPIWHSSGVSHYHGDKECRGLKGATGVKQKTECAICGEGSVASSSTRPNDWQM